MFMLALTILASIGLAFKTVKRRRRSARLLSSDLNDVDRPVYTLASTSNSSLDGSSPTSPLDPVTVTSAPTVSGSTLTSTSVSKSDYTSIPGTASYPTSAYDPASAPTSTLASGHACASVFQPKGDNVQNQDDTLDTKFMKNREKALSDIKKVITKTYENKGAKPKTILNTIDE